MGKDLYVLCLALLHRPISVAPKFGFQPTNQISKQGATNHEERILDQDGPDNWEKMSSYEFARFMETADGKSRKENIARVPGGESGEPIIYMEVDSQTAKEWKRENNRACYLQKTMNALGIEVISYNVSPNAEDWEVNGDALLENPDCHVEDDVLRSILTENMLDAMCHLSEIEQKVITHLYLSEDPMTEHEFEKAFGVKRCTVHYYKGNALEKLRKMLRENV